MRIKTRTKKLANGFETIFFDIHVNGTRRTESTGIKFKANPSTEADKKDKKEKQRAIAILLRKKELDLLNGVNHLEQGYNPTRNFIAYVDEFIANHQVQEIKKFHAMRSKLVDFAKREKISCFEITESFLRKFVHFLEAKLQGESPSNYFAKLKQIIKAALRDRVLVGDPVGGIVVRKRQFLQKDVLNYAEIIKVAQTPLGNDTVKKAFLFCLFTGLRYCDVSQLRWEDVYENRISIVQKKTKNSLSIPLIPDARNQLPKRGDNQELVFKMPSHTACQKWVKRLIEEAGIEKKIWHC